jgi:alpha-1,3-mannosyltransferase
MFKVAIKMNMLLYSPGLLLLLLMGTGLQGTFECLRLYNSSYLTPSIHLNTHINGHLCLYYSICAGLQILMGWPFLINYPIEYITKSFDLGRVFMYKWTVNYKFLPEEIFLNKSLSIGLLLLTILGDNFIAKILITLTECNYL